MGLNANYILNGLQGGSATRLLETNMDPGVLRPWREMRPNYDGIPEWTGRSFMTLNVGKTFDPKTGLDVPIYKNFLCNTPALLRREDWLRIDTKVSWSAKQRLRLWGDIYSKNPYNVPNGMGVIGIQHTIASGDASATLSMDPIRQGERTRSTLDLGLTPLPVTHGDGSFSLRDIMVSRNSGMELNLTGIALQARKNAEIVEKLALGTFGTFIYNGGTIYGLTNHPSRSTKTMTLPTAGGYTANTTITEVLAMIKTLKDHFYYGKYTLYYSNAWAPYFDNDYQVYYAGETLASRMAKNLDIAEMKNLDFFGTTAFKIVLVQMTDDVIEGVQGMDFTTVQWEEQGGFEQCFKVLSIQVPRTKVDANGFVGIVDGTAT